MLEERRNPERAHDLDELFKMVREMRTDIKVELANLHKRIDDHMTREEDGLKVLTEKIDNLSSITDAFPPGADGKVDKYRHRQEHDYIAEQREDSRETVHTVKRMGVEALTKGAIELAKWGLIAYLSLHTIGKV